MEQGRHEVDKRQGIRYEVLDYAMVYQTEEPEPIRSIIVDIGLGGLQIRSKDSLPVGAICHLNVGNLDAAPLRIRGEVRHSNRVTGSNLFATGIKFLPETHDERSSVAEYVHSVFQRQTDRLVP